MVCALSWLQSALTSGSAKRLLVLDEAWAVLGHLATARWLQAAFKLSRAYGVANVAVVHRLSDLKAAGDEGSQEQRLAEGLLADAETRVVSAKPRGRPNAPVSCLASPAPSKCVEPAAPRRGFVAGRAKLVPRRARAVPGRTALADTDGAMRADGGGAAGAPTSVELRVGDPLAGDALLPRRSGQ